MLLYKHTISYVPSDTLAPFPSSCVPGSVSTVSLSSGSRISRLRDRFHNGVALTAASNISPTVSSGKESGLRGSKSRYLTRPAPDVAPKSKDASAVWELFSLNGRDERCRLFGV